MREREGAACIQLVMLWAAHSRSLIGCNIINLWYEILSSFPERVSGFPLPRNRSPCPIIEKVTPPPPYKKILKNFVVSKIILLFATENGFLLFFLLKFMFNKDVLEQEISFSNYV